jgi:hypothetical protein
MNYLQLLNYIISNKLKLEVSITVTVNNSYDYIISNKLKLEVRHNSNCK